MKITGKIGRVPISAYVLVNEKIGGKRERKGAIEGVYNGRIFLLDLDLLPWRTTRENAEADLRAFLTALGAHLDPAETDGSEKI